MVPGSQRCCGCLPARPCRPAGAGSPVQAWTWVTRQSGLRQRRRSPRPHISRITRVCVACAMERRGARVRAGRAARAGATVARAAGGAVEGLSAKGRGHPGTARPTGFGGGRRAVRRPRRRSLPGAARADPRGHHARSTVVFSDHRERDIRPHADVIWTLADGGVHEHSVDRPSPHLPGLPGVLDVEEAGGRLRLVVGSEHSDRALATLVAHGWHVIAVQADAAPDRVRIDAVAPGGAR